MSQPCITMAEHWKQQPSASRSEKDIVDTTKNMPMTTTVATSIRYRLVNMVSLYRCLRARNCAIVAARR